MKAKNSREYLQDYLLRLITLEFLDTCQSFRGFHSNTACKAGVYWRFLAYSDIHLYTAY